MVFICDRAEDALEHLKQYWLSQESEGLILSPKKEPLYKALPAEKRQRLALEGEPPRPMPPKAYKNKEFINSGHCRIFRIQCEMEDTRMRLEAEGINNMLMFLGSSSVGNYEDHLRDFVKATEQGNQTDLVRLARQQPLLKFHEVSRDLSRRITAWSMARHELGKTSYHVASSGEPGLVESAHEGAWEAGGKSIAFSAGSAANPFNRYVTPELAFVLCRSLRKLLAFEALFLVGLEEGADRLRRD